MTISVTSFSTEGDTAPYSGEAEQLFCNFSEIHGFLLVPEHLTIPLHPTCLAAAGPSSCFKRTSRHEHLLPSVGSKPVQPQPGGGLQISKKKHSLQMSTINRWFGQVAQCHTPTAEQAAGRPLPGAPRLLLTPRVPLKGPPEASRPNHKLLSRCVAQPWSPSSHRNHCSHALGALLALEGPLLLDWK